MVHQMNNYVLQFGPGDQVTRVDGTIGIVEGFWEVAIIYRLKDDPHAYYDYQLKVAK